MSPARAPASRRLRVNGLVTHYLDAGDGEPLVLLHGGEFGAGAEVTWHRALPALAAHRHVVALDLLGFGRSDKVRDLVDQRARIVAQVADVLDALCVDEADVVGTSFSARLLLDVAAADPRRWRLRRCVAIGLGLDPPSRSARTALGGFDGSEASMTPTMELLFHDPDVRRRELAARLELARLPGAWQSGMVPTIGRPPGAPPRERNHHAAPATARYDVIDRPTLLVRGEHDALVTADDFAALAAAMPFARTATIAAAGHYPHVEQPDATVRTITEFLA